jgi:hypothetical protein
MRGVRHRILRSVALIAGLAPFPLAALAQVGQTTDIITGVVVNQTGDPLADVTIEVTSLDTRITRSAVTDEQGRYVLLFPDGGGQYRVTARLIGALAQTAILVRHADEDRLVWDVTLQDHVYVLDPAVVTGQAIARPIRPLDRPTPGELQQTLTPDMIANLPVSNEDLALLATLVPGAIVLNPTDSTEAAFSVAGQRPDANVTTLDGMTFSSGQMPQEGLRATRIVTSTYDVSRGRFSGGLLASTTRSGANVVQGSLSYALRDDDLTLETGETTDFTSGFTQHALGGGLGGPIAQNRLFLYGSGSARLRSDPLAALTTATVTDLARLGLAADSAQRFIRIVDALGAAPAARPTDDRSNVALSGLLRLDYLLSSNHTLTLRADLRDQGQEPTRLGPTALPETSGENHTTGAGLMASLSSRFGNRIINEGRAYYSASHRVSDPFWVLPQGRVHVESDLADGSTGITTLVLGGNASMPTAADSKSLELSDEVSWLPGAARHRIKLGGLFRFDESTDANGFDQWGTFTFNSLADLEAGAPASFRRTLDMTDRAGSAIEYAVYAADAWSPTRSLQVAVGLRAEGSALGDAPMSNPALETALEVRNDRLPRETALSPRVGVTWMVGGGAATPPAFIIRGGVGKFRSPVPLGLASQARSATGLGDAESVLECVGVVVPAADWAAYRGDPAGIPVACTGPATPIEERAPSAFVFARDFGAPATWRASLGVQRSLGTLLRLSADFSYARGVSQYGFRDLNLDVARGFRLAAEADRPVFVDAAAIVPATGAVSSRFSRVDSSFAQVLETRSDLESETKQLTLSLGGFTRNGIVLQLGYTWSDVRDQSSQSVRFGAGRFGGTSTSGDPNALEWARSSYQRRHSFVSTMSHPFGASLDLTAIARLSSGTPFTPMVAADINGDGAANDQAFVFDAATHPGVAALLGTAPSGVADCLRRQVGTVAARNSCTGPWQGSLELQLNYRPGFLGLWHRATVSVTTMNLLHGVDRLLHGADGLKGWGLAARPDDQLLFVTGFDPDTRQFQYAVNQRFGATDPGTTAIRQPFQIGIQVRSTFGPDRARDALLLMRGAGMRGGMGPGMGPGLGGEPGAGRRGPGGMGGVTGEGFLERFRSLLVNPAALVLERADSLGLSREQIARLDALRDSIAAVHDSLGAALQKDLDSLGAGGAAEPRALLTMIRPRMEQALQGVRQEVQAVRAVLTEEQWGRLPERLRQIGEGRAFPRGTGIRPRQ